MHIEAQKPHRRVVAARKKQRGTPSNWSHPKSAFVFKRSLECQWGMIAGKTAHPDIS